jgi:hypothetical protein
MGYNQNFFKKLDLFGIMFNFRMPDYQKYKSKTGAIVTILCILSCLSASYYEIKNFFDPDNNFTEKIYYRRNDSINLVNQNFTFAIGLPNVLTGNNLEDSFWNIDVLYRKSEGLVNSERNYKNENINKTKCNLKDFNIQNNTIETNLNLFCFKFDKTQTIMGEYFSKIFSFVEINLSTKKKFFNLTSLEKGKLTYNIFYPKNFLKDPSRYDKIEKSFSNIYNVINTQVRMRLNIYLQNSLYKEDLGNIFKETKKYSYTNLERTEIELNPEKISNKEDEDKIELTKIYLKDDGLQKRHHKSSFKIFGLFRRILSNFVTILFFTRFFMGLINLLKARKSIIESSIFVDDNYAEESNKINMKNICINSFENNKKNHKKEEENQNNNTNKKNNNNNITNFNSNLNIFQKEKNITTLPNSINSIELIETDNYKDKKNNNGDIDNDNRKNSNHFISSNDIKTLNGKMIEKENLEKSFIDHNLDNSFEEDNDDTYKDNEIDKKIKDLKNKVKRQTRISIVTTNLKSLIWSYICCDYIKKTKISNMFKFTSNRFNNYLYIVNYIRRMEEIETLKKFLFENIDDVKIFNQLSVPKIKIRNEKIVNDNLLKLNEEGKDDSYLKSYYNINLIKENKTIEETKFIRMIEEYVK